MFHFTRVSQLAQVVGLYVVMEYVKAARLWGEEFRWLLCKEIQPNIMPPLIAEFGLRLYCVFLTISAFSFF
jgi:peptide/nickel transport system permease protein